jgi:cytochrome oxidase Cu insertion factor (SCO1/SenC/PrrC family)
VNQKKKPLVAVPATRDSWRRDLLIALGLAAALLLAIGSVARAHERPGDAPAAPATPNAHLSSAQQYTVPAVRLVRDDGRVVSLPEELNDGRPVVLNFIFTTCSSFCPLMSQTFAEFDGKLGADRARVHLMSISTDPEEDTPPRLREYAHKFHAGPEWQHYTGTVEASLAAQRAFNAFRGDKMSHTPLTLLRAAPGQPWLRIEGFVTPTELLKLYRQQLDRAAQSSVATR